MFVEYIGMPFLFLCYDFQSPRLATSESYEHTFGNYRKGEREFTFQRLLQLEDMNRRKHRQCTKAKWRCIDLEMEVDTK